MNWTEFVDSEFFWATRAFQNFQRRSVEDMLTGRKLRFSTFAHNCPSKFLLDFAMDSMFVAVRAELAEFHTCCGVTTIFHRSVTRHARRSLVRIGPTLGTFERNNNSYAFTFCQGLKPLKGGTCFKHEYPLFHRSSHFAH